ncbi:MAG: hypothetical protein IT518_14170 [Burkholderiales bacterium]|nr:hypothetical protein [Burkholderiales bacterium]
MSYVTSLEEVAWGIALVAITMAIHGCGMLATLFACHAVRQETNEPVSFFRSGAMLILEDFQNTQLSLIHKRRADRHSRKQHG